MKFIYLLITALFIFIVFLIIRLILNHFFFKKNNIIRIFFGLPGAGKTTVASAISHKMLKHNIPVYSNVPIKDTFKITMSDFGHFNMDGGHIIVDEAGLELDNRSFKSNFSDPYKLEFFKLFRHYNCSIDLFSQTTDIDKKVRDITHNLYIVRKGIIPKTIVCKKIKKKVGVNEFTKDICDDYELYKILGMKIYFAPLYWKYFDTVDGRELPKKEFKKWNSTDSLFDYREYEISSKPKK